MSLGISSYVHICKGAVVPFSTCQEGEAWLHSFFISYVAEVSV